MWDTILLHFLKFVECVAPRVFKCFECLCLLTEVKRSFRDGCLLAGSLGPIFDATFGQRIVVVRIGRSYGHFLTGLLGRCERGQVGGAVGLGRDLFELLHWRVLLLLQVVDFYAKMMRLKFGRRMCRETRNDVVLNQYFATALAVGGRFERSSVIGDAQWSAMFGSIILSLTLGEKGCRSNWLLVLVTSPSKVWYRRRSAGANSLSDSVLSRV